jgi:hypothetical protein
VIRSQAAAGSVSGGLGDAGTDRLHVGAALAAPEWLEIGNTARSDLLWQRQPHLNDRGASQDGGAVSVTRPDRRSPAPDMTGTAALSCCFLDNDLYDCTVARPGRSARRPKRRSGQPRRHGALH